MRGRRNKSVYRLSDNQDEFPLQTHQTVKKTSNFCKSMIKIPILKDKKYRMNWGKEFTTKTFKSSSNSMFIDKSFLRKETEYTALRLSNRDFDKSHSNFRIYLSKNPVLSI